jgi:hypothetical protein
MAVARRVHSLCHEHRERHINQPKLTAINTGRVACTLIIYNTLQFLQARTVDGCDRALTIDHARRQFMR